MRPRPSGLAAVIVLAFGAILAGCTEKPPPAEERTPRSGAIAHGVASPPATASATPSVTRAVSPGRFVVSEYRGTETWLFSVSAANPADRRPLARIEHAPNWAPRAAIAPSGDLIAYTVLLAGARSPDTEGTLWVIALTAREPRRLAARIDARVTPVWSPDSTRVVYQRVLPTAGSGMTATLEEVDVRDGKARELVQAPPARLFPVGYAPDAVRFYYVRFESDGALLHKVDTHNRASRPVAHLGEGAVRDLKLAPDGSAVLYLALTGSPPRYEARIADLRTGKVQAVLSQVDRSEDVGVAWRPGQGGSAIPTVGTVSPDSVTTGRILAGPSGTLIGETAHGFDVPVAWSTDGRLLLVRGFSGRSADDPGREQPALVDGEGIRRPLVGDGPLAIVGWVGDAP